MKKTLLLLLICLTTFSFQAQNKVKDSLSDAINLIDNWLEAQYQYDNIPGLSVGIVKDQELIWSKGYGMSNVEEGVEASPETIYSICSISKLFTSIAIMQLVEQGKLELDDSISQVLPSFNISQQFNESGPITIRSLLTHSSGLPRESDFPYWTGPDFAFPTQQQVQEKLGEQETLYDASTYFQYSNLGMTLLGEVIKEVSGMPYDEYVEQNILKPLRLANTNPYLPKDKWGEEMATGYSAIKRDGTRDQIDLFDAKGITAAAGYSSTVEDLADFASWQFRLLENGGKEILKASTLKNMQRVHFADPNWKTFWGLGFSVYESDGKTLVGHGGSCPGYRTTIVLEPGEKMAYIVMANAMVNPGRYASEMRNILNKGEGKKKADSTSVNLKEYTGTYNGQPWSSEVQVVPWYGQLAVVDFPSSSVASNLTLLKHVKGDTFRRIRDDKSLGEEIKFERNSAGKVTKMWQHSNFSDRMDVAQN